MASFNQQYQSPPIQQHQQLQQQQYQSPSSSIQSKKLVAESIFELLLIEILNTQYAGSDNDNNSILLQRLDAIGYDVGFRLVEKVVANFKFSGTEPLDLVKFLCRDLWEEIFQKKIDKLQTNHRGVFVLSDSKFKWLDKYASDDIKSKEAAARLLHFPCGIIRGALANLGLVAIVNADFNTLPACSFNIRVKTN